ncbi:MAG TPA: D-aminoacyl-tRNA deacylase [Actinomycetota bacterium]|nr:D-aminoacyl-tRNA deacylase [Actinomycetota bacterium]
MRVLLQRVERASVRVRGDTVAAIGRGLVLLVGIGAGDDGSAVERLAEKLATLRVFEDVDGKTNRSLADVNGEVLLVPQFTLYGDVRKGRRPSFDAAAQPEVAAEQLETLARALEALGVPVRRGAFREHMAVELVNDGPFTLWLETDAG